MNILKLERKCGVCNGQGIVTMENIYFLKDTVKKFRETRSSQLSDFLDGNSLSFNVKESPMELEYKRRFDVAVESFELNCGDCKECAGAKIVLTEDGKNMLRFLKKHFNIKDEK